MTLQNGNENEAFENGASSIDVLPVEENTQKSTAEKINVEIHTNNNEINIEQKEVLNYVLEYKEENENDNRNSNLESKCTEVDENDNACIPERTIFPRVDRINDDGSNEAGSSKEQTNSEEKESVVPNNDEKQYNVVTGDSNALTGDSNGLDSRKRDLRRSIILVPRLTGAIPKKRSEYNLRRYGHPLIKHEIREQQQRLGNLDHERSRPRPHPESGPENFQAQATQDDSLQASGARGNEGCQQTDSTESITL